MGCSKTNEKYEDRMYFIPNNNYMLANRNNNINKCVPLPNNYNQINAPLPNNYNQVNENKIFQNFIYCPSCGHPLGNNF